jgi:hypothetical protein
MGKTSEHIKSAAYRAAVLHGWTPGTYLQRTLRGRAREYMGRYLDRLERALQADEAAGRATRVRSIGGRSTWVPVSPDCEALEPVRDGHRLIGWMTSAGVVLTPAEYLRAVGLAGPADHPDRHLAERAADWRDPIAWCAGRPAPC